MFKSLNYYSRYNRVKTPQQIKSLLIYIDPTNLSGCMDDSHIFFINKRNQFDEKKFKSYQRGNRLIDSKQQYIHEHRRYASYDAYNSKISSNKQKLVQKIDENYKKSEFNQFSIPKISGKSIQVESARNRTNLQDMNCQQTQSIRHGDQSDKFSEGQHIIFPQSYSHKQDHRQNSQRVSDAEEDNFSSVKINEIFDLHKKSMQQHTPLKFNDNQTKSQCIQRQLLSDLDMGSQICDEQAILDLVFHKQQPNNENISKNHNRKLSEKLQHCSLTQSRIVNQSNTNQQQKRVDEQQDQEISQYSQVQQNYQKFNNKIEPENYHQQNILEYVEDQHNNEEQYEHDDYEQNYEQNNLEKHDQNILDNQASVNQMIFGYQNKDMRIGYQNYKQQNNEQKVQIKKINKNIVLEDDKKIAISIINQNQSNTASKISLPQRKPFKKYMMNKKLNPRMTTSTIVNQLGEKKPQKVNFKKMMKKQKSENRIKFEDIKASRTTKKDKSPQKNKLIMAFFQQN